MQTAFVPGFRFKNGVLRVFSEQAVMVVHAWPRLEAVRKSVGDVCWQSFSPAFRLVRPYRRRIKPEDSSQLQLPLETTRGRPTVGEQRKWALDSFRFTLPKNMAACVEPFPAHQWRVLLLFKREPRAVDVAQNNPLLIFCLANGGLLGGEPAPCDIGCAAKWVLRPQREILGALGFPATNAVARILAKFSPEAASAEIFECLQAVLQHAELTQTLSHLPRINLGVVALLKQLNTRAVVTPQLLAEVAGQPREKYRGVTAKRIEDISLMLRELDREPPPRRYRSVAEVAADHEATFREFAKHKLLCAQPVGFPLPPLPGTTAIVPLRTPWELHNEGTIQDNCVGSYRELVLQGRVYIYRVMHPQRATLSIGRGADGNWEIRELFQSHNRPVDEATEAHVEAWLQQYFEVG